MTRQRIPDWLQVDVLTIVVGIAIIGAGIFIASARRSYISQWETGHDN